MRKTTAIISFMLVFAGMALANPAHEDKGNEASNALYQGIGGGDCDDSDYCPRPGKVELYRMTFNDSDDDGDGVPTVETEVLSTNRGQITSALTSERPKFKAGAELSKKINSAYGGDLDGDGLPDVVLSVDRNGDTITLIGAFPTDWKLPKTEAMGKPELVEAIATDSGLSKADAKRALDTLIKLAEKPRR